jgi:hypothetical protein
MGDTSLCYINIILNTVHHLHLQENGVPQGSVLSVTLFVLAINNTADAVGPSVSTSLYVYDITVFYGSSRYKHTWMMVIGDNILNFTIGSGLWLLLCMCACVCVHKPHFLNAACSFISSEMLGSHFTFYKNFVLGFKCLHYTAHSLPFISPILILIDHYNLSVKHMVFSGKTE